jgi:hypothetical protein
MKPNLHDLSEPMDVQGYFTTSFVVLNPMNIS